MVKPAWQPWTPGNADNIDFVECKSHRGNTCYSVLQWMSLTGFDCIWSSVQAQGKVWVICILAMLTKSDFCLCLLILSFHAGCWHLTSNTLAYRVSVALLKYNLDMSRSTPKGLQGKHQSCMLLAPLWTACSETDERKHQISASLAFIRGIHRWPVIPLHKGPVTRKIFLFDDVIMPQHDQGLLIRIPRKSVWFLINFSLR